MTDVRVCHVITDLGTGGAELALFRLIPALHAQGFSSSVVSLGSIGPVGEAMLESGISVRALGARSRGDNRLPTKGADAARLATLVPAVRAEHPDIVQTWMYHADLAGGLAAKVLRVPVVWGLRMSAIRPGTQKATTTLTVRASARLSGLLPAAIVACSDEVSRDHTAAGYRGDRMRVIYNGFELPARPHADRSIRERLGVDEDEVLIARVARFHPMKDWPTMVETAASVTSRNRSAKFLFVGEGVDDPAGPVHAGVSKAQLEGRVHLLGRTSDMGSVYGAVDLACSSSSSGEGFPNVIGEAMSHGVPVVATDVGASATLIGDTGSVVAPGNAEALAAALEDLVRDSDRRRALGDAARQRVAREFSMERMALRYADLYREVLARP